ncbi:ESPR-type extended signal peptide-containing protein [Veillonella dispar]|uniref:ESPR-type extended signal peptide-containing protein n=1 Tax=Veillonella dispar TaxID=39778 RepID=UPI0026F209D6|nr:ESPR-type extended signal peptide-containing protein [Veillonella dispar]
MNKIFKVVWSKSKECYVVVSEFAKNNSGKKKIVVAGIFAALAMTNANVALAANTLPIVADPTSVGFGAGANVSGRNSVGLGTNVQAEKSDVVAIGNGANADFEGSVAIGQNAYSSGRFTKTASVAVGRNSIAKGNTAVAIGNSATVNSAGNPYSQGIAIGGGADPGQGAEVVGDQGIAIGGNTKALGHSSIVIGGDDADKMVSTKAVYTDINTGKATVGTVSAAVKALTGYEIKYRDYNNATADHIGITVGTKGQSGNAGIAIGTGADSKNRIAGALNGVNTSGLDNTSVTNAIAIGTGAKANRDNSVALGGGSTTDLAGTKQTSYTLPNGVVASWSGGNSTLEGDIVSFGAAGYERQLKNVAPGEVSATSTDAINGSQLAAIADQVAHKYVSINSNDNPNKDNTGAKANNSIAIGPNASTDTAATSSVAIGDGASATVTNGVAIGSNSVASTAAGIAGYNSNTGRTDKYTGLSGATLTSTLGGVAVGTTDQTRQINYVAAGTADTDAVNVAQLKSVNLAFTGDTGSGDVNLANSELAVNGDNTYIETKANGKKITIAGKKQDITVTNGKAAGTAGMADAKNVAEAINHAIDQNKYTWDLSANGEATPVTVEKGNKVDFSGDDNITVARNDKNISVSLKKDLTGLNSASFNNAAGNPTVKIDGDKGINAGDMKVTNVADGIDDKDAVNVSQLKKTDAKAEANKTAIDKNTTALANKISLEGNTGSTTEKSLNDGAVSFKIKGEDGIATTAAGNDVTVKLDTDTKNKINNAADKDLSNLNPAGEQKVKDLAAWKVVANSGTAENVKGGDTVKFIDGDNIEITQAGKNFTIATKKDVTFDNITATQAITAPTVNATTGVVTPQVTGLTNRDWTPGQTTPVPGRAATEDQLKAVDNQVATNKQNIADNKTAIDKNTTAIARKIFLNGNTGTTTKKSLSADDVDFTIKGEDGITTTASGNDVTVKLDTDTKNKIDNAADKDLSNLTPDGKKQVKDLAAWKVVANSGTAEDVKGGDTVKYINGDNIVITQSGKDFTFATKPDVTFNTVTANDTITAPKVKATTGVETPQVTGLTNKTWDPNNITSGRAATEDQLKVVDDQVQANKDNITQNAGDIATNKTNIAKNAGDIADNKTAINKNAGDIANNAREIAANKDKIDQNTTAIARKISLGSDDGDTDKKSLSTGDVKFNIKGENGITTAANGVDVTVKLDDATKDKIDNAANRDLSNLTPTGKQQVKDLAAWNVVANNGTAEKVQGGDTVKFIDGDNVTITQNGKDFTVATKKDVTFDNVTANQKITAPEVSGLTNTTWNPGVTQPVSGRAATEDQLKAVDDEVAKNKKNIADNKTAIDKNAGDIAANKTQIDQNTKAIARNISLGSDNGDTTKKSLSTGDVKFNIKGQNGIVTEANGDDVTVKLDDATANKINNAANTDLSNLTDAGKQQVKDLSAWNVVANNGTAEKVEGGNTVKFIDGDNISITQNGKDFTIATKKDVTFDTVTANDTITAPKVKATDGVETPEVTGLTNKTWTPGVTQPVSGRAATEDQLKAVDDQVAENKTNIGKNADNIAANKAQIDKNTEAIGRKISLGGNTGSTDKKSLSTGDVKFNIKGENGLTTVANGEDVTVKIDDATKAKIDNAANQDLSNLTPAGKQQVKDLSAWNVTAAGGTVEKVQGGDTVKFQAGDNLEVKQDGTTFTYSLAKDVKGLNSVTVGDENGPSTKITPAGTTVKDAAGNATTVNGAGMTINPANSAASPVSLTVDGLNNGGNQIHGVAPGTADTDAVNVSQLKETKAGLQQAINNVGVETQRVGAHAAAMAALKPIQYDPLEPTQIMAGIGNYRGETAGAIGLAHYKTEDTMFNIGVTLGSSHNMINAGVTHKFGGSRDRKDAIPERYKAGPISSIYVMQDEVSHLRSQNEEYKSKLEQQQSEIDALKAAVNQLLANKA